MPDSQLLLACEMHNAAASFPRWLAAGRGHSPKSAGTRLKCVSARQDGAADRTEHIEPAL
jgi:hypothetical protein